MGDPPKTPTQNFYSILGIPKSATLADICKAYKSLVLKWHPDRNPTNKAEAADKFTSIAEAYRALSIKKREDESTNNGDHETKTPKKNGKKDVDELQISNPTLLSRTTSVYSPLASPNSSTFRNQGNAIIPPSMDFYPFFPVGGGTTPGTPTEINSLPKAASRRLSTPILYSQSAARRKPPAIEKKLACTLEELCHGCAKKIKITRDIISSSGLIVQEEEILMIKVNPGWKKGTKITFEGKGDERPGTLPADIIFIIDEKRHPIFKREGDDLELGVEIPLVQALTGCTISIPLLGGEEISLSISDIIYPGYEKIIPGEGMTKSKEDGVGGDLILKFLVEFPQELTDEERSEVVSILEECS